MVLPIKLACGEEEVSEDSTSDRTAFEKKNFQ